MDSPIRKVVILGGGTAGWLAAAIIASEHQAHLEQAIDVTLIESPDICSIGVGEGTWPTMRSTLKKIGLSETEFLLACDASFKQGTEFRGWYTGLPDDQYFHPFSVPQDYAEINLQPFWQPQSEAVNYAQAVSPQPALCLHSLAPKQNTTPEYAFIANYGYHLDAGKFATLLKQHCCHKLGVNYISDHVESVEQNQQTGEVSGLNTRNNGLIGGDLFVDCSGMRGVLLKQHYQIDFNDQNSTLFNDRAIATQVPYGDDDTIASHTISTAQTAGWVWDIGLPTRRGVGYTYSSQHTSLSAAQDCLQNYIENASSTKSATKTSPELSMREIKFTPGYLKKFWHKNCVAVGMASGFLEPLEASALVMVELAATMISQQLPPNRQVMKTIEKRYNEKFTRHWQQIIEFLKLHYILSKRDDSDYWRDNTNQALIPETLQEKLDLWKYNPPWHHDFPYNDEVFSSASYQYVLYGMGFRSALSHPEKLNVDHGRAIEAFRTNQQISQQLVSQMPGNRELLDKIKRYGLQKI